MQAEQIETPHKIKGFDAVAHDNMIRRMAFQVVENNKASQETVKEKVAEIRQQLKDAKPTNNQFIKTKRKLSGLVALARHCSTVAGA
jgi:hypothetical protein